MANTIGKDKGSATQGAQAAEPDTDPVEGLSENEPLDAGDSSFAKGGFDSPADSQLTRRQSEAASRRGAGVPEWMMGNFFTRYLAESYLELRKVTWPTRHEAWNMTLIVIAMSAIVAVILGAADLGLIQALGWVVKLGTGK